MTALGTIGSLFSGIGGLELGLERAGWGPVLWQCEKDEFCRAVLASHWPNAERFTDVQQLTADALAPVDLMCGGFPCQDVSAAGARAGLGGSRSSLWYDFLWLIDAMRPGWVVVENVTSGAVNWVDEVRGNLGEIDYDSLPITLAASDVGAWHRRSRLFIIAHHNNKEQPWRQGAACEWQEGMEIAGEYASDTDGTRELQPAPPRATSGNGLATTIGRLGTPGPLNPTWLEWYMGFPRDWLGFDDEVKRHSETVSSRSKPRSSDG